VLYHSGCVPGAEDRSGGAGNASARMPPIIPFAVLGLVCDPGEPSDAKMAMCSTSARTSRAGWSNEQMAGPIE
jgi:hypothetical protein